MSITEDNLAFLKQLAKNNNRDWFADHKSDYTKQHENTIAFADELLSKLNQHDTIETLNGKKSLYRIYRDVRFSLDKSPYKTHWAGGFSRATKKLRGGYYFQIAPNNNSFIAAGFWAPNKEDLQRIREEIAVDADELRTILADKDFVKTFGELQGEQLKSAPKGFDKEHPNIDLLRYKQFIVTKRYTDSEVHDSDFADKVNDAFKNIRPFFDYMSEVLTTDANGNTIL